MVDKLGPEANEEDNLNASSILYDALETKEYYSIVSRRNNVNKLLAFAIPPSSEDHTNQDSQNAALSVLSQLVSLYTDRKKSGDTKRKNSDGEEEDATLQQHSDEDDSAEGSSLIDIIAANIPNIVTYLQR